MVKKPYPAEQIINKLREAEVVISQGTSISEATNSKLSQSSGSLRYSCIRYSPGLTATDRSKLDWRASI